jgi:hypothetical protein
MTVQFEGEWLSRADKDPTGSEERFAEQSCAFYEAGQAVVAYLLGLSFVPVWIDPGDLQDRPSSKPCRPWQPTELLRSDDVARILPISRRRIEVMAAEGCVANMESIHAKSQWSGIQAAT